MLRLALVLLLATPALGQSYAQQQQEARRLQRSGNLSGALRIWRALLPDAADQTDAVRWEIARCLEQMNRHGQAFDAYDALQADSQEGPFRERAQQRMAALERHIYGELEVRCTPEGATVKLGGPQQRKGVCPELFRQLPRGRYDLRLLQKGLVVRALKVQVHAGRLERVEVRLPARLVVSSTTPGRKVRLNGRPVGITPLNTEVEPGRHQLSVERVEGGPWKHLVRVEEGKTHIVDAPEGAEGGALSWVYGGAALATTGAAVGLILADEPDSGLAYAGYASAGVSAALIGLLIWELSK